MRLRYYLLLLIASCSIGGMVLSYALFQKHRSIDLQLYQTGENPLVIKDLKSMKDGFDRLLVTADLVIGADETYLIDGALIQINQLQEIRVELTGMRLMGEFQFELRTMGDRLKQLSKFIQMKADPVYADNAGLEEEPEENEVVMLDGSHPRTETESQKINHLYDDVSFELVAGVEDLTDKANEAAEEDNARLAEERENLSKLALLGGPGYVLLVALLGRWAWTRVAMPIQTLTNAANRSMTRDEPFDIPETGPTEIRLLTRNVARFVGQLEEQVEQRTAELNTKTETLKLEVEERIKAEDQAKEASRAKSEFLANMSHEIRTPLNAVIGLTEVLLKDELTHDQHDCMTTIQTSSDALLSIINDILDFSKIESGHLDLELREFNLWNCVEEAIEILTEKASSGGLELIYDIDYDGPNALIGDVTRLRQVLVNLITNAIKFTKEGEIVVSVSSKVIESSASTAAGQLRYRTEFSVRDSGIGIPEDRLEGIFESFTQADTSTTRQYGGTGLGLAICQRLVNLMGGEMVLTSTVGAGSDFRFSIECDGLFCTKLDHQQKAPRNLSRKKVLLVHGNDVARRAISVRLSHWNLQIDDTANPAEAREWLTGRGGYSVGMIDVSSAAADGACGFAEFRDAALDAALPLIAISPSRLEATSYKTKDVEVIPKPVRSATLYDTISRINSGTPIKRIEENSDVKNEAGIAARYPLRILLAEDHKINQKVIRKLLGKIGYTASIANNGLEALEQLEKDEFDLVLLDVQMPVMDGISAAQKISQQMSRETRPWMTALTANATNEDRKKCLDAGMDDFLTKPVRGEQLKAALIFCHEQRSGKLSDPGSGSELALPH